MSQVLEPDSVRREMYRNQVVEHGESFLSDIDTRKAYVLTPDKGAKIREFPLSDSGIGMSKALEIVAEAVDLPGLNPASGGHLGYIPGGGIYLSALGDYLADITNRYAGMFFPNPGAVRMENMLVRWMADLVGYPETASGTLLSGGSLANLTCIVTARDAMGVKSAVVPHAVIYLTNQVHHCVTKALRIAGLTESHVRYVPTDSNYRLDVSALRTLVAEDKAKGLKPFMVVCSTGTTDTGAVDPVDQVADLAEEEGLWLHVDAAYGGFFLLCEEGRAAIKGLERSDSIVMDPHKGLFLPYGTGVAIVKRGDKLAESHHYTAAYLQDTLLQQDEISPADVSPELTRHFRGMRMWLPLQVHGLAPFKAALAEKLWLARYFHEQIIAIPGMERGPFPDLSVVLFRYVPQTGDSNAFMHKLLAAIHHDGRVFLSSTQIDGKMFLRFACLSFRTHLHTVDLCLKMLKECVEKVKTQQWA